MMACSSANLPLRFRASFPQTANTKPQAQSCIAATIRELIDLCNGSVAFSVKVVCANLRLSQSRMTQEFKSCYGVTILEYWSAVRLRHACALLSESPSRSISSIAVELGYQHANNFTNWFTRRMDISPQKYVTNLEMRTANSIPLGRPITASRGS
jgi:AraC-like DNA-binding protein